MRRVVLILVCLVLPAAFARADAPLECPGARRQSEWFPSQGPFRILTVRWWEGREKRYFSVDYLGGVTYGGDDFTRFGRIGLNAEAIPLGKLVLEPAFAAEVATRTGDYEIVFEAPRLAVGKCGAGPACKRLIGTIRAIIDARFPPKGFGDLPHGLRRLTWEAGGNSRSRKLELWADGTLTFTVTDEDERATVATKVAPEEVAAVSAVVTSLARIEAYRADPGGYASHVFDTVEVALECETVKRSVVFRENPARDAAQALIRKHFTRSSVAALWERFLE